MTDPQSKLPPQNLEAEVSVLGGMLIDNESIHRVAELLRPEDFYREAHRKIYQAIVTLYQANEPSDLLTVTHQLKKTEHLEAAGGAAAALQLLIL